MRAGIVCGGGLAVLVGLLLSGMWMEPAANSRLGSASELPVPSRARVISAACPPGEDDERLFGAHNTWRLFSQVWPHLREPALACGSVDSAVPVYRITWVSTFLPMYAPISVRVFPQGATYRVMATTFEPRVDQRRMQWPDDRRTSVKDISDTEWAPVSALLVRSGFWSMRSHVRQPGDDGSHWLIEGRTATSYHVVERWSPEDGPFRQLAIAMLQLGGLGDPEPR